MSYLSSLELAASRAFGIVTGLTGGFITVALAGTIATSSAEAQVVRHGTVVTPHGVAHRTTVIDRGRPGWWHGHPGFNGYAGPRPGHYFAPGHGYYAVPRAYVGRTWVVGGTFPPAMQRYVVVQPAVYGLAVPPPGYGWYYADTNFVLVALATGVIAQSVAGGW